MKQKRIVSILLVLVLLLAMVPMGIAAEKLDATPVTLGEKITLKAEGYTQYWYSVETTKAGQIIKVESNYGNFEFYDSAEKTLGRSYNSTEDGYCYYVTTNDAGKYYLCIYHYDSIPRDYAFTVTLVENDSFAPNNTAEKAHGLTSGVPVEFTTYGEDIDYFTIETTKDGQDVQLDFSGFDYTTTGYLELEVNETSLTDYSGIRGNSTYYYHASKAGKQIICVGRDGIMDQFTLTATVLDGDANEANDTLEQATRLHVGTDKKFSMGGYGDQDWFTFESAFDEGKSPKLYTLNLLDLSSDYSDEFYYDLYAPDGTKLMDGMEVNIRHNNVIACQQEGLYALRLYRTSGTAPRTELRIRVDEGGADPYEANDTWLTAAEVQTEQPIQFILSNTEDVDWFKFEVPEAYMTMCLNSSSSVVCYLYSAADLQEFGTSKYIAYRYNFTNTYYQFETPGTYYLKVTSNLSDITQDLRTLTITLEEATAEEPNNSWKTATPLYAGVPMEYDVSASNDYDWFKFEVPEGVKEVRIFNNESDWRHVYREKDFQTAGDNAAYFAGGNHTDTITLKSPAAGVYYLKDGGDRLMDQTIVYHLIMDLPAQSIEEAEPITEGQWTEDIYGGYYALGSLKEGDQIRFYSDNVSRIYLYDAAGEQQWYSFVESYQNTARSIPADGTYYLEVVPYDSYNNDANDDYADGSYKPYRFLVDIADRDLNEDEDGNRTEAFTLEGPDTITLRVGETAELDLRVAPYDARVDREGEMFRIYNAEDSSIASVSNAYRRGHYVRGQAVGSTTVECYLYKANGYTSSVRKTITINVVESALTPAQSVTILNTPALLPLGSSVTLQASLTPAQSDDRITWTSSDPRVLYVSDKGKVTAVGDGSATITVTAESGVSKAVTIAVTDAPPKPVVTALTLNDYDMTLYMGEGGGQLKATVMPADSPATVSWVSSNLKAATVDQNGKITPVAPGVTVITASAGDYRASCIVTVQGERINVESITFDSPVLEIPLGGESALRPTITPADATVQSVTWTSTDPNVATVSRTGIVNALAVGNTIITVTTLDGGHQAAIVVRVTTAPQPGDINGDGYVDAADAMITLQVAVGKLKLTEEQEKAADVSGDGWVDAADAVRILRYFAGYIDSLED